MKQQLTTITISIPYKRAGNVISQQPVTFDVYQADDQYSLVPLLNSDELSVANLPQELVFVMQNGKPVSERGPKDGNFHVIQDGVKLLQEQNLLPA